jgi:hypothetical protein
MRFWPFLFVSLEMVAAIDLLLDFCCSFVIYVCVKAYDMVHLMLYDGY